MAEARASRAGRIPSGAGVMVIGLGRFGSALASTLSRLGHEVLAVDTSPALVQHWSNRFAAVEADGADPEALAQLGVSEFPVVVVAIGTYIEASVLTTGNLVDAGVPQIWAKATTPEHSRILERIGAHHVVLPEADVGERVAHLVSGRLIDYIEVEDGFTIVKMRPPPEIVGVPLSQSRPRTRWGATIIGVKRPGAAFEYAVPETVVTHDDLIIVWGSSADLERFAARS